MKIKDFEFYVALLLYLYIKGRADLVSITDDLSKENEVKINSQKLRRTYEKWKKENVVDKIKRKKIVMGEFKHEYEVKEQGIQLLRALILEIVDAFLIKKEENADFLKGLAEKIQNALDSKKEINNTEFLRILTDKIRKALET